MIERKRRTDARVSVSKSRFNRKVGNGELKLMRYIIALSIFALTACVEGTPENLAAAASDIQIEYDKFRDETVVRTPLYLSRQGLTDRFPVSIAYEARQKSGRIQSVRLFVEATRTEWGFYQSATGDDGFNFSFFGVDREVGTPGGLVIVEERFSLGVPYEQLRAMSLNDYEIKVYGKRDSGVFVVPASLTRAFLQSLAAL